MLKRAARWAFVTSLFVPLGCGSDEESDTGTGGVSSGGTGASSGGSGGAATGGGSGGTQTGGSGGGETGGSGGSATGGSAGSAGGAAGSGGTATGGAAGNATGGSGGGSGAWGCTEQAGGCSCSTATPGASPSCSGTYSCCYTWNDACDCLDLGTQQCDQTIKSLKGTKVAKCPP